MSDEWAALGPAAIGRFSRRRALGMSGAIGLAALCSASMDAIGGCDVTRSSRANAGLATVQNVGQATAPPRGVLGANFNGDPDWARFAELQAVSATWLRAFFTMPDADHGVVANQPVIRTLLAAHARGYRTVLSLKFPYFDQPIPSPGSPAMATALRRLTAVLPAVMGTVDVLVIGNEPFIECQDRNSNALNVFYETMAQHAISYREQHRTTTQLYMGALNHLDQPTWRTPATDRWMTYVRQTPALDGVDIHPHLAAVGADKAYLDYILPRMRADQTFLATEFSLVLLWKEHLTDPVSTEFAARYGLPNRTLVWQVIEDAIKQPFPQPKWDNLLSMSPWFADNRNYLTNQVAKFRATGRLAVATYGVTQEADMITHFGPGSTPWLLNSLFCPYTVQPGPNGLPGQTTPWIEEFRALQH